MRTVRKLATLLGTLVAGLALILLGAPAATAGGPTSVLLASPTTAKAAALTAQGDRYQQLSDLLDIGTSVEGEKAPSMDKLLDGQMVNVTWMIHDVEPWRVDRIYVLPPGKGISPVWIHTAGGAGESLDLANGTWHRPRLPADLTGFLASLKLLHYSGAGDLVPPPEDRTPDESTDDAANTNQDTPAATGTDRSTPTATPSTDVATGWWWAFPGIAAGAALALGSRPLARQLPSLTTRLRESRAATREEGTRGELIDR
ncbi:hypothetical protein ACIBI4_08980 [Streptomyces sp. NPDC050418]|uniref:hypothetical protein n=1 Tax=Streptomyces sp. NPDC050418 TaxID=3365612 RepID=UPI0037959875